MKIPIQHGVVALLLMGSTASAHPGRNPNRHVEPCPYLKDQKREELLVKIGQGHKQPQMRHLAERTGDGGIPDDGFAAVEADLIDMMKKSHPEWPVDGTGSYAGLFIRLAWHCSGSYRESDGRGGCDGGRIRFVPELTWADNANLDKAIGLLQPIKNKYGSKLSWGDLIILSGNAAIKSTGGPILGFCGGRIDDADGSNSIRLGPSAEQELIGPCITENMNGQCLEVDGTALGPTTLELIYVNPAGPITAPGDTVACGADIRKAFSRMGFDDQTSAVLIGGGHAIGRAHGACLNPPCGDGLGENISTSGFEGKWTTTPTAWTNMFYKNLFNFEWTNITGPGGAIQWAPHNPNGTPAPDIFMLTSDLALRDDTGYLPYSQRYAANLTALNTDFAAAWYRLTSADMGPANRCIGDDVPNPQKFQHTLPASPETLPNYVLIRTAIDEHLEKNVEDVAGFISLAYGCASTFRETDYRGGCNGARIRFSPEKDWPSNAGLAKLTAKLESMKTINNFEVSTADLIVLAGIVALEKSQPQLDIPFCGGYVDASDGAGSKGLAPRIYDTPYITITDDYLVKGLTMEQGVALASRAAVGSQWYKDLLATDGTSSSFTEFELALLEGNLTQYVQKFANDEASLITTFKSAWTYLMTADRYKNYRDNACTGVDTLTTANNNIRQDPSGAAAMKTALSVTPGLVAMILAF